MEQFNPNNRFNIPREPQMQYRDQNTAFNNVEGFWQQDLRPAERRKRVGLLMFIVVMIYIGVSIVTASMMMLFDMTDNVPALLVLNTITITIGAVLVPSLIYVFKGHDSEEKYNITPLHGNQIIPCILFGLGFCAAMYVAANILSAIYTSAGVQLQDTGTVLPDNHSPIYFIISTLCIAVAPAICEEFLCRSAILYSMRRLGMYRAALWSGLYFALLHVNLVSLPIYVALGFLFGVIAYKTRSVFSTMIIHFVYNFSIIALEFFVPTSESAAEAFTVTSPDLWIFCGVMTVVAAIFLVPATLIFKHNCRKNDIREAEKAGLSVTEYLDGYNKGGDADPYLGKGFIIASLCILAGFTVSSGLLGFVK